MFIIEHMMPLCMTVSWIYTVALAVQAIVYEKEQRLKEVMKMMGLSNAVHWVAWFITSLVVMSITVSLLVAILKVLNSFAQPIGNVFFSRITRLLCLAPVTCSMFAERKISTVRSPKHQCVP